MEKYYPLYSIPERNRDKSPGAQAGFIFFNTVDKNEIRLAHK